MKKLLVFLFIKLPLALILLSVLWVVVLKWVPVYFTPIMISRSIEYKDDPEFHTIKKWCKLEDISSEMIKAAIASEDNLFCKHNGFDEKAIRQAIQEKKDGRRTRGASTISQQTAKNVFTFHRRSFVRKGVEAWFTVLIEKIWGKERIMEVYLNIVEVGKGVYGVQAAAEQYYKKDASKLTRSEACTIVSVFPTPLKSSVAHPSSYIKKRSSDVARLIPKIAYPEWIERKKPKA